MPRIYVVSTVRGTESVVRQLLCEPVVGVSCQGTGHTSKTGFFVFFFCFCPTQKFFTCMETSPLPGKGCKFLPMLGTHGHWSSSIEGSFACHTYCDTRYPFITVISEDPCTKTYCRAFSSGAVTTCFYDLGMSRLGFEHLTFRLRGQRSKSTAPPPRSK